MEGEHFNANGQRRVSRDEQDLDASDDKLQVESPISSPPPTPSRVQLPNHSSPNNIEAQNKDNELHPHQGTKHLPSSPLKRTMAMDMDSYGSAQESSMMGDDMDDRAAHGALRSAPSGHERQNGAYDRYDASPEKDGEHYGRPPPPQDETPRQRQHYSDDEMDQSMMSQSAAPGFAKPKGKGRGKAAFPKGGENTPASAYTGHKIKHLKKEDGEPLWRKDIQYDFLDYIFRNDVKCFTNSYEPTTAKQCFADLYIDTMARSSKTSKILREKLQSEREPAKNMAMVCLLVNLGRMNTTLNCKLPRAHVNVEAMLTGNSLPRNARPTPHLPRHPSSPSTTRPKLLQTTSRRTTS